MTSHSKRQHAQRWAQADAPIIWLFGKTQSGKTSIVAEMTGQAYDQIGDGFEPVTKQATLYAFPPEQPALRFLDTRGLGDVEDYDPATDLNQAEQQAHVLLVTARVDDLDLGEILTNLQKLRLRHPQWPLIVAQTTLHHGYRAQDRHLLPYPFDGTANDYDLPGLSESLRQVLMAQRQLFAQLPGALPPQFVPLDFTQPDQQLPPTDYGAQRLWEVLETILPDTVAYLKSTQETTTASHIRTKVVLPWALSAAAANAIPLPVLGGIGSASIQAAMVNHIARRLGHDLTFDHWGKFVSALGTGFALGYGSRWLVQQGLKLGIGWGSALVASWTFAITWGLGEAAIYYFTETAAGRDPKREEIIARYRSALSHARQLYQKRNEQTKSS